MDPDFYTYNFHTKWKETYESLWNKWISLGRPGFGILEWIAETYGTKFTLSGRLIVKVEIVDNKLHHFMLLKHG